jgi:type II secretory pathway component PulF
MMNVALGAMTTGEGGGVSGVMAYVGDWVNFQIKAGVVFALLAAIAIVLARMGSLGWITGFFSTHIWPMSTISREMGLARFFKSFSLLLGSGLDIVRCVQNAAASTANPYLERDLLKSLPAIRSGATLTEAFRHTRYLTPMSRNMLETGEISGRLETQLSKASEYHFSHGTAAMHRATTVFGTLIVLGVCLVIGGLIISFYSRLYGGIMDELGI